MPIMMKDIYSFFPNVNQNTIRSIFKRIDDNGLIVKIKNGVYALPNPKSIMGKPAVYISDVIKKKYIGDETRIIGYTTGLNFANQLGLTTQTASIDSVISNAVSNKKREIKLNNNRLIVNAPRVEVNINNYKLLQILDLLNDYNTLCEVDLKTARINIIKYISELNLDSNELEKIVSIYPLEAQVRFYKIGGQYAVTSEQRDI